MRESSLGVAMIIKGCGGLCKAEGVDVTPLLEDLLFALSDSCRMLPGGGPALTTDILRDAAIRLVKRRFAGRQGEAADVVEALEICMQVHVDCTHPAGLTAQPGSNERTVLSFNAADCPLSPHCSRLQELSIDSVCFQRLFVEQALEFLTGKKVASILSAVMADGVCAFEIFPTSPRMLGHITRMRRNAEMLSLESQVAKSRLSRVETLHKLILETVADAIVVIDEAGCVVYLNPRACGVFAVSAEAAMGKRFEKGSCFGSVGDLCVEAAANLGAWEGQATIENFDRGQLQNIYQVRFSPVRRDSRREGTLVVLEDVTREESLLREASEHSEKLEVAVTEKTLELTRANKKLRRLARTDPLTGLANRRMFEEILKKETKRAVRNDQNLAILVADIDNFKSVNDTFGHPKGDEVLKMVADLLVDSVRESDTVARWGGDEFIVLLPQSDEANCRAVVERIERTFAAEFGCVDFAQQVQLGLSVGWSAGEPLDTSSLIAQADMMMYCTKSSRKARSVS